MCAASTIAITEQPLTIHPPPYRLIKLSRNLFCPRRARIDLNTWEGPRVSAKDVVPGVLSSAGSCDPDSIVSGGICKGRRAIALGEASLKPHLIASGSTRWID